MWNKNSHNLFDFENLQLIKRDFEMDYSGKVFDLENEVVSLQLNEYI